MGHQKGSRIDLEKDLKTIMPVKGPLMMLDEVKLPEDRRTLTAKKRLKRGAWYFKGHFPGRPVMPGHLIAETMVQACALLLGKLGSFDMKDHVFFLSSSRARFFRMAGEGDTLDITVSPVKIISNAGVMRAETKIHGKMVARGEFTLALAKKRSVK